MTGALTAELRAYLESAGAQFFLRRVRVFLYRRFLRSGIRHAPTLRRDLLGVASVRFCQPVRTPITCSDKRRKRNMGGRKGQKPEELAGNFPRQLPSASADAQYVCGRKTEDGNIGIIRKTRPGMGEIKTSLLFDITSVSLSRHPPNSGAAWPRRFRYGGRSPG